jgi:hypothetical protein
MAIGINKLKIWWSCCIISLDNSELPFQLISLNFVN